MKKQTKTNRPLVSVIMPVYNAEEYLSEAIKSIFNQTYRNFELIIINDSSTDRSLEIIKKYQKEMGGGKWETKGDSLSETKGVSSQRMIFKRSHLAMQGETLRTKGKIRLINLKHNLNCGGDKCANIGILKAKGKYIARMDADDVSHPRRLEKQVEFLEQNPDIFLVGTNAFVIDKKGKLMGEKLEPQSYESIKKSYFTFHPLIHPTCMYRRILPVLSTSKEASATIRGALPSVIPMKMGIQLTKRRRSRIKSGMTIKEREFRYQIGYSANNDYYTFFKLICVGYKFANLKEKLLYFRIHGKNDTFIKMKEKYLNTLKVRIKMVLKYGYRPGIKSLTIATVQTAVIFILPEKILKEIYFVFKGIKRVELKNILYIRSFFVKIIGEKV